MTVFSLVRLHIVGTFGTQRLGFVNNTFLYVVVKLDTHANRHAVGFHVTGTVIVFRLIRIAQESHFKIGIGILVDDSHTTRILAEHFEHPGTDVVRQPRIKRLVFDFVNFDRLDMARQRRGRKAIATRQKGSYKKHQDKNQPRHIP